jgi:hypothetical protein
MDTGAIRLDEIEDAICMMKKGKAPGDDKITADMLKADTALSAGILYPLSRAWEEETTLKDFRNGTIITLPKKGDLGKCDNWRGITLLSVPGKVLCRIIYTHTHTIGWDASSIALKAGWRRHFERTSCFWGSWLLSGNSLL